MVGSPERAGSASEDSADVTAQENVSDRNRLGRSGSTKQNVRHRASVACASCRERRIRCVVPKGQNKCDQCRRNGTQCVIKNDDERRRPISKAYMSSLSERITLLESMLAEKGVHAPPAAHPPMTRRDSHNKLTDEQSTQPGGIASASRTAAFASSLEVPTPPDSVSEGILTAQDKSNVLNSAAGSTAYALPTDDAYPYPMPDLRHGDVVHRLLSPKGDLSFDQLSGNLRCFGPTANIHSYDDSSENFILREQPEQVRRAERIIRSLSEETYNYLMTNFWDYYNAVLNIIHREAFESDRDSQVPKFYSCFLHISILAMGFRFADFERPDMKKITIGSRESSLHREAKYMLDIELERPGGIPSVQALLLLGDLECGVGRDNTGWMYAGMANRLAFDIGLHLDCRNRGINDMEVNIRHLAMKACVIYDKYWALFLGRPTSIKNQDIGMELLEKHFSLLSASFGSSPEPSTNTDTNSSLNGEIYEQLIEVMELAGRIVETRDNSPARYRTDQNKDHTQQGPGSAIEDAYLQVVDLDRQLQNWYRRLPDHLQWKPANVKTAPLSFFLLHQQYHVSLILLHRPWAKYGASTGSEGSSASSVPSPAGSTGVTTLPQNTAGGNPNDSMSQSIGSPPNPADDARTARARNICTQQAIAVARIFWQHRQRFEGTKIFITGMQHAGAASTALIAALAHQENDADRRAYLGYLGILSDAVNDMALTYHHATRMARLINAVLGQFRAEMGDSSADGAGSHSSETAGYSASQQAPGMVSSVSGSVLSDSGRQLGKETMYSVLPARRGSTALIGETEGPLQKKSRPSSNRASSDVVQPIAPFSTTAARSTPTGRDNNHFAPGPYGAQSMPPAMYNVGSAMGVHHNPTGQQHMHTLSQEGFDPYGMSGHALAGNVMEEQGRTSPVFTHPQSQWGLGQHQGPHGHGVGYQDHMPGWPHGPAGMSSTSVDSIVPSNVVATQGVQEGYGIDNSSISPGGQMHPGGFKPGMPWMGNQGSVGGMGHHMGMNGMVQGGMHGQEAPSDPSASGTYIKSEHQGQDMEYFGYDG